MASVWDYPISTEYGWVEGYPLHTDPTDKIIPPDQKAKYPGSGYGFHTGNDWAAPDNSDVVVNGQVIAKSNHTGAAIGPHLHVSKMVDGLIADPHYGGKTVDGAVITVVAQDAVNGKYTRLKGSDGADWIYDHLNVQLVKVGDKIGGEIVLDENGVDNTFLSALRRHAKPEDIKYWTGQPYDVCLASLMNTSEYADVNRLYELGKSADKGVINLEKGRLYKT